MESDNQNTFFRESHVDRNQYWTRIRLAVALILLVAAGLKAYQLATAPSLGEGILHARWFNILIVEFELFFGIWLIFGMLPKLTWLATIGLFSMFTIVSFYKAVSGEASCGCFGNVVVNPWMTAVFDIFIAGLLIVFCPKRDKFRKNVWEIFCQELLGLRQYGKIAIGVMTWFAAALPVTYVVVFADFVILSEESQLSGNERSITLEPMNWLGKKFPLFDHIDFENDFCSEKLKTGEWFILLYRNDCLECQMILAKIENQLPHNNFENLLMIEVPGKEDQKYRTFNRSNILWGSLCRDSMWFMQTPVLLKLNDGTVLDVFRNENILSVKN